MIIIGKDKKNLIAVNANKIIKGKIEKTYNPITGERKVKDDSTGKIVYDIGESKPYMLLELRK